jgi:RimJ/RimL family protein N-acetyltransferase
MLDLLNTPKFIKYIGDRNVRNIEQSEDFIETRYQKSYDENGYGLYLVELKQDKSAIGVCGFVKRAELPVADIGFAFFPQFEGKGFAFESAEAVMQYGGKVLNFERVAAITTQDNVRSGKLLEKLGFKFEKLVDMPTGETLKLFSMEF